MRQRLASSTLLAILLIASCLQCEALQLARRAHARITHLNDLNKPDELSGARLLEAARAGGDYLIRMQRSDGSFHYYYDARLDHFESRRYNVVRHAGTAASLLELYQATGDARYLESAKRAVYFLSKRFRRARSRDGLYVLDYDGKAKLGANGLALLALAKLIKLDPRSTDRQTAARLANLILALQRRNGSFEARYRLASGSAAGPESLYYPGEAILGLLSLFSLNGDRRLLEAARRGADFLIESQKRMTALPADAWLMQALEALYVIGREKTYVDHAIALAKAMMASQYTDEAPHGYSGGFGPGPPRATPAASRAEGLAAAYRIARSTGDVRAAMIAASLKACARFQLAQQFTGANSALLPNPPRAAGGFRESAASFGIRIDFVQHNISSLLAIAEALY